MPSSSRNHNGSPYYAIVLKGNGAEMIEEALASLSAGRSRYDSLLSMQRLEQKYSCHRLSYVERLNLWRQVAIIARAASVRLMSMRINVEINNKPGRVALPSLVGDV